MSKKAELISSYFPTIYLTVISLLQGIALSQLVPSLINYLEIPGQPLLGVEGLPILLMLLIIFVVWHHYAISIFFLRWFPNIIDTIIPFMVSIGQFVLISYITIENSVAEIQLEPWTIGFAIFLSTGSLAYFSAAYRLEPDLFTNIMSKEHAAIHGMKTKKYFSMAGLSILFQGIVAGVIAMVAQYELLWISVALFIIHLVSFECILLYSIKPHYVSAMDEFERERNKQ